MFKIIVFVIKGGNNIWIFLMNKLIIIIRILLINWELKIVVILKLVLMVIKIGIYVKFVFIIIGNCEFIFLKIGKSWINVVIVEKINDVWIKIVVLLGFNW